MRAQPWQLAAGKLFLALSVLSMLALAGCGQLALAGPSPTATATTALAGGPANHDVIIPQTDLFAPYLLAINSGDSVTWMNDDTMVTLWPAHPPLPSPLVPAC